MWCRVWPRFAATRWRSAHGTRPAFRLPGGPPAAESSERSSHCGFRSGRKGTTYMTVAVRESRTGDSVADRC